MESLIAAISQGSDEAKERMRDFLEGRVAKIKVAEGESDSTDQASSQERDSK